MRARKEGSVMPESLMRHAHGFPGFSDLAEEAAAALAAVRHAATVIGSGAAVANEVTMLAEHVGEMRAKLAALATVELAVTAIYEAGRRDERAAIEAARGRHAARRPHPHLRAVKAVLPAAFIGTWGLIRHALGAHRLHVAAAAMTTAALTSAVTVTMVTVPSVTTMPQHVILAPAATLPAPVSAPAAAALSRHHRRHRRTLAAVGPRPPRSPAAHSPSPRPSPTAAPSSSQPSGEVTASPVILADGTGQLVLTARGGPVDWSLTCTPGLSLPEPPSGHLDTGQSTAITVTSASPVAGGTIWLWPGDIPVQVRPPSG